MKQKYPRSYRGGLQQDLHRSKAFKDRIMVLDERQRKLTEEMSKPGISRDRFAALIEKRDKVGGAIARYDIRAHDRSAVRYLTEAYESLPVVQKLRNEVAHRMARELSVQAETERIERSREIRKLKRAYTYASEKERDLIQRKMDVIEGRAQRTNELNHPMALLAASVKLVTGVDSSAAVRKAKEIRAVLQKDDATVIGEAADDIFLNGENSIYMKPLNNHLRRKNSV